MTPSAIRKLGKDLRKNEHSIAQENLLKLQEYRICFREPLGKTFNLICELSYKIEPNSIIVARIKRFQTIHNKLIREPTMQLNTMADIAGCRVILSKLENVYKLVDVIANDTNFEIIRTKDYNIEESPDGYKSLHLNLRHKSSPLPIELQIRTETQHDWATLVEITDVMFKTKLKERGQPDDFFQFFKNLSDYSKLSISEKIMLCKFSISKKFAETIMDTFITNNKNNRLTWLSLFTKSSHKFFIVTLDKAFHPKISSFANYKIAESEYFKEYQSNERLNSVLIFNRKPSFEVVSKAYSNYLLLSHKYINQYHLRLLFEVINYSITEKKYFLFIKMYYNLNNFALKELDWILYQSDEYNLKQNDNLDKRKLNEWKKDNIRNIHLRVDILTKISENTQSYAAQNLPCRILLFLINLLFMPRTAYKNYQFRKVISSRKKKSLKN